MPWAKNGPTVCSDGDGDGSRQEAAGHSEEEARLVKEVARLQAAALAEQVCPSLLLRAAVLCVQWCLAHKKSPPRRTLR